MDFITIGIIARNEEDSIGTTLRYLLAQKYPHDLLEIVVVDGNSSDGTRETCESILSAGDISYKIINEANIQSEELGCHYGHSFARNVVLDHMDQQSKYLAWIDADCRATEDWLYNLYEKIRISPEDVAAVGGSRYVESEGDVSKRELMLNYYFSSCIMSLWNPAFCGKPVEYMSSVAGYNSMYKVDILKKFRYDTTYPFNTDDIEINYRLSRAGYKFLYSQDAKIYHRMNETIRQFLSHLITYGKGATNVMKLHKSIPRLYIPIALLYIIYILTLPLLFLVLGGILGYVSVFCIFLLALAVFFENFIKTRSGWSLFIFLLVPLHPFMYGIGICKGLLENK